MANQHLKILMKEVRFFIDSNLLKRLNQPIYFLEGFDDMTDDMSADEDDEYSDLDEDEENDDEDEQNFVA